MKKLMIIMMAYFVIAFSSLYSQNLISLDQSQIITEQIFSHLISIYPEWKNASIAETPITFNDLDGRPFVYLYEIKAVYKAAGYCAISAYDDLPLLNEASAAISPLYNAAKCENVLFKKLNIQDEAQSLKTEFISTGFGLFYIKFSFKDSSFFYNLITCSSIDQKKIRNQQKIIDQIRIEKAEIFKKEWEEILVDNSLKRASTVSSSKQLNVEGFNWYRGCVPTSQAMALKYIGSRRSIFSNLDCNISNFWWTGPTDWPEDDWTAPYNPSNSQRHSARSLVDRFANHYNLKNSGGELKDYDVPASAQAGGFTYVASSYGYSFRADKTSPSSWKVKTEIDNDRPLKGGFKNDEIYGTHAVCIIGYTNGGSISVFWNTYQYSSTKTRSTSAFDNLVRVFPDIRVPEDVSSIEEALNLANYNERVIVNSGTYTFNDNFEIASDEWLHIKDGVTFKFASGKKMIVNGKLGISGSSQSKAVFKATSGTWYGIDFTSSCSWYSMQGGKFKDMTNGLVFNNCDMNIEYCEFEDNNIGINIKNYSDVYLKHSRVENFASTGIKCQQHGSLYAYPYNIICDNLTGVWGDNTCWMKLGYSSDQKGMNSIFNLSWDINSSYPSSIYARYNWWGGENPSPLVTNNVVWEPCLDYDPNNVGLSKTVAQLSSLDLNQIPTPLCSTIDSVGLKEFEEALELFTNEDYQQALNTFQVLVNQYPEHFAGEQSLVFVNRCFKRLDRSDEALYYLDQISKTYKNLNLDGIAQSISIGYFIQQDSYQSAIIRAQGIVQSFPKSEFAKYALYDLGSIYWYYLKEYKTAEKYYRQLIAQYPKDDLSISALVTLGESKPEEQRRPYSQPAMAKENNKPEDFASLQIYPNPFNPVTHIRYKLVEDAHVIIKIYNLLGEEIIILVDEMKRAGSYSLQWKGRDHFGNLVASGIYLLRMQTNNIMYQRKLLFVR